MGAPVFLFDRRRAVPQKAVHSNDVHKKERKSCGMRYYHDKCV